LSRRSSRCPWRREACASRLALAFADTGARAQAQDADFVIRDIRVEGAQRTEAGTVFGYLPLRVGDRYDAAKGVAAIRALYATGLFKDVRLEADGDVLLVVVEERPAIASIELVGMKEFDKDTVKKSLKTLDWPRRASTTVPCWTAPSRN